MSDELRSPRRRGSNLSGRRYIRVKLSLLRRDGPYCRWCLRKMRPKRLTLDHLLPRRLGGTEALVNLVLACGPCNNGRPGPDGL